MENEFGTRLPGSGPLGTLKNPLPGGKWVRMAAKLSSVSAYTTSLGACVLGLRITRSATPGRTRDEIGARP